MINAYFYTLEKLKEKEKMLQSVNAQVLQEEQKLELQKKEELIPSIEELKKKIPAK